MSADVADLGAPDETEIDADIDIDVQAPKKKPFKRPLVKTLTENDLPHYSIYDVIMPLPGSDVEYPGGELGEKYRAYMYADGLDPDNLTHKRRCVTSDSHASDDV